MNGPVRGAKKIDVLGVRGQCGLVVYGGLQYIAGNETPHFTLTCQIVQGRRDIGGGAAHETILKAYPQYADLAALHLSDIDGVPMHAVANAWHFLCGAVEGGHGERHHAGNSGTPKNQDACLKAFADHVRVDLDEAARLRDTLTTRAELEAWVEEQKPRYKAEAAACRLKHDLKIFGDRWTEAS